MKKLILLAFAIFCTSACTRVCNEYMATISYTIEGGEVKTEQRITPLPQGWEPVYFYDNHTLYVSGTNGNDVYYLRHTIYTGLLKIEVKSFEYELVRTYNASVWDGHEVK